MAVWNDNGSIKLSAEETKILIEILTEWKSNGSSWTNSPDCEGWETDIDARENRRENITFKNCYRQIAALLGRKELDKRTKDLRNE